MTKIELTPAFLIHRRMYQDSSLLLDFFTRNYGKIRLVARAARSNKTSLQMFQRLNISFKGRSELKNLTNWESSDHPRRFLGNDLVLAIYTNELLSRLLPEAEKHQKVFDGYWNYLIMINEQSDAEKEYSLRLFENLLLEELGYGLEFNKDSTGSPIDSELEYQFQEHEGFVAKVDGNIPGEVLLVVNDVGDNDRLSVGHLAILKKLNRKRLRSILGERPLKSRELFFAN
jgi:DNA repair protein RecO (recombination protein O)